MFFLLCGSCADPNLKTLPAQFGKENVGEVQKFLIWRLKKDDGTFNEVSIANAALQATWDVLLAANDDTKVQVSPTVHGVANEPGANNTYGGPGITAGGVQIIVSRSAGSLTGNFISVAQEDIAAMRACPDVGVILLNDCGQLVGLKDGATNFRPIPADAFDIGDKVMGQGTAPDTNAVSWQLKSGWADLIQFINPTDYVPLTDLVNQ